MRWFRRRRLSRRAVLSVLAALIVVGAGIAAGVIVWRSSGGQSTSAYVDDFQGTRVATPLVRTGGRHRWIQVEGVWTVGPDGAAVARPALPWSLVVINTGTTDGQVQTTLSRTTNGAGLVFREQDANNYWALTAAPTFTTWNIYKVLSGIRIFEGNVGPVGTTGPKTIAVQQNGASLDFYVGGKHVRRLTDTALNGATRAGLVSVTDDPRVARWTTFTADVK